MKEERQTLGIMSSSNEQRDLLKDPSNNISLTQNPDPSNFESTESFYNSLHEIQFLNKYFQALKNGSPKDVNFIKYALKNDPRKDLRDSKDDLRRGNLSYLGGEFPLYVACKNNHIKIIKILIVGKFPIKAKMI